MKSLRIIPESYFDDINHFFNQLPEKHAEKQIEKSQHELSIGLMADTVYLPFYEVFMGLNNIYGPNGDYASLYLKNPAFIRCRYPTIFTRRQQEFSHHWPITDTHTEITDHQPGKISSGDYPAAKINFDEGNHDKFSVLGEGPFQHTLSTLLTHLENLKINNIVAVGPQTENGKEKYYDYLKNAEEISAKKYLQSTTKMKNIPELFNNSDNFTIKFYRYKNPENNNIFFVMHMTNWKDLGLPNFTDFDKQLLAYDAEFGGNRFYHCSAGVGRSVTVLVMHAVYELIFKKNLKLNEAVNTFENILTKIKEVKPRAGEWWQLLLAIGFAEDMYHYLKPKLIFSTEYSATSHLFTNLFPKIQLTLPLRQLARSEMYCTALGMGCAPIGNYPKPLSDDMAYETIKKAYDCGVRVFDTAPLYGYGLSERRVGEALSRFKIPRDKIFLSSKVGRILVPESQSQSPSLFSDSDPYRDVFDYSYEGIMNAITGSLTRLNTTYLDVAHVHDLGKFTHGDKHKEMSEIFVKSGYQALLDLKQQGVIKAIGIGVNEFKIVLKLLKKYNLDFDVIMLAQRYTLLEQGKGSEEFFRECEARNISVMIAAPLSSGILSDNPNNTAYQYGKVPKKVFDKKEEIKKICNAENVHLQQAALQFPLRQPAVKTVVMGARSPKEIEQAVQHVNRNIPDALWNNLEAKGFIPKQHISNLVTVRCV